MQRVLITGAAGFLGSHLADRFLTEGYEVVGVDNFITGSEQNIANLQEREGFSFLNHDISTSLYLSEELDGVLHFASPASPVDYLELPIQTLKVGSLGTHNMLGLSLAKSARFLLASTSEVYGDPEVHPQTEDYWGNVNPIGLRGVYDEAKRFAEAMTMAYHRYHGVDTRIVRIFNTYGPSMRPADGRVVSNFIVQALRNEPLTIFGDGTQTRCFCHVSDVVKGLVALSEHPEAFGRVFNLGGGEEVSIKELAERVIELAGSQSSLEFLPYDVAYEAGFEDMERRVPDTERARQLVGFEPSTSLDDIVRSVIEDQQA